MLQFCFRAGRKRVKWVKLFDRNPLLAELRQRGLAEWAEQLGQLCENRLAGSSHGSMPQWIKTWHQLPEAGELQLAHSATDACVIVHGETDSQDELRDTLMRFHPWRKGPFRVLGVDIDTEWRSNLKWDRLSSVDFRGKTVLDVGCGNGYYGWKMLAEGADLVLGCDPTPLYLMQYEVLRRYAGTPEKHFVVPLADVDLPDRLAFFDLAFSMGVLYHRTSPIDHLQKMFSTLRPDGQLILETLVIESDEPEVLLPEDRYAKMRNVWFIPSIPMLRRWLKRTGFTEIELLDIAPTTVEEQRSTDWMRFESLADFLDPLDRSATIEGYPAPLRAILAAKRGPS